MNLNPDAYVTREVPLDGGRKPYMQVSQGLFVQEGTARACKDIGRKRVEGGHVEGDNRKKSPLYALVPYNDEKVNVLYDPDDICRYMYLIMVNNASKCIYE